MAPLTPQESFRVQASTQPFDASDGKFEVDEQDEQESQSSSSVSRTTNSNRSSSNTSGGGGSTKSVLNDRLSDKKENRTILMLRIILGAILISGCALASYFMFHVTRASESDQFESHYQDNAIKLIDTFASRLRNKIAALDNYAVVSSTDAGEKDTWPFVVSPRFEVRAGSTMELARAGLIFVIPLVEGNDRMKWEEFTRNNTAWIDEGKKFEEFLSSNSMAVDQEHEQHDHRALLANGVSSTELLHLYHESRRTEHVVDAVAAESIFRISPSDHARIEDESAGPYFPAWQSTPVHVEMVNYNLLTHPSFGADLQRSANASRIVFSKIADVSDIHDPFRFLYRPPARAGSIEESEHSDAIGEDPDHEDDHGDQNGQNHDEGGMNRGRMAAEVNDTRDEIHEDGDDTHGNNEEELRGEDFGDPAIMTFFPIFDHIEEPRQFVGNLAAAIYWSDFFIHALSPQAKPLSVVLSNECGQVFTYRVVGEHVEVLGKGDRHEQKFDSMAGFTFHFDEIAGNDGQPVTFSGVSIDVDYCPYRVEVYPTGDMEDAYITKMPAVYASMVIATFLFATIAFVVYDTIVSRRQKKTSEKAEATSAVINSLFPANVRDRLFRKDGGGNKNEAAQAFLTTSEARKEGGLQGHKQGPPIADLFPYATVLFADIAGFTAWCSSREPTQVFILLETVYGKFDSLARRRRVFKVETIGDSYVAATGLPEPQSDHAIRMVNFAVSCLDKLSVLTKELESTLGPDTGSLQMRFGIHSGSVTAGVLRGEKSRFQLFGDTVNTASRMESTGKAGLIQCSEATAALLRASGHERMLMQRPEKVVAKGKGEIQTYWIIPKTTENNSSSPVDTASLSGAAEEATSNPTLESIFKDRRNRIFTTSFENRLDRLVDWNVDVLHRQLRNLAAYRMEHKTMQVSEMKPAFLPLASREKNHPPRQDIKEAISMPTASILGDLSVQQGSNNATLEIPEAALDQLRDYVKKIASMYRHTNPFHNFDHAAHVTLSAQKLLSRIVSPTTGISSDFLVSSTNVTKKNAFAYGISNDPLTHCAIIFSAMIHDVDHPGVTNHQLIVEGTAVARDYDNKSIAEQNSIDLAWDLLMESTYDDLRACLFTTQAEYDRFRSLVVNTIIATDIFDKELKDFRQLRWDKAFGTKSSGDSNNGSVDGGGISEDFNGINDLKATIVIEHLIQASDVAHTMQHWHVYQKWNEKLFAEMFMAYQSGRMEKNPVDGWYNGELWFFDNYIIPLAKKLFDCGVFGVSSDEYLAYAMENRREFEQKGAELVRRWVRKYGMASQPQQTKQQGEGKSTGQDVQKAD